MEHERKRWREFRVDVHLKESWLEELNSLRSSELISICEGHPTKLSAHIRIRPKEEYLGILIDHLDDHIESLHAKINELFSDHCHANIMNTNRWSTNNPIYKSLSISVANKINGHGCEFNSDTEEWFEKTIPCIKEFDLFLYSIIREIENYIAI